MGWGAGLSLSFPSLEGKAGAPGLRGRKPRCFLLPVGLAQSSVHQLQLGGWELRGRGGCGCVGLCGLRAKASLSPKELQRGLKLLSR